MILTAKSKLQLKNTLLILGVGLTPWALWVFLYVTPWIESMPLVHPNTTLDELNNHFIGLFIMVMGGVFTPLIMLFWLAGYISKKLGWLKPQV